MPLLVLKSISQKVKNLACNVLIHLAEGEARAPVGEGCPGTIEWWDHSVASCIWGLSGRYCLRMVGLFSDAQFIPGKSVEGRLQTFCFLPERGNSLFLVRGGAVAKYAFPSCSVSLFSLSLSFSTGVTEHVFKSPFAKASAAAEPTEVRRHSPALPYDTPSLCALTKVTKAF